MPPIADFAPWLPSPGNHTRALHGPDEFAPKRLPRVLLTLPPAGVMRPPGYRSRRMMGVRQQLVGGDIQALTGRLV